MTYNHIMYFRGVPKKVDINNQEVGGAVNDKLRRLTDPSLMDYRAQVESELGITVLDPKRVVALSSSLEKAESEIERRGRIRRGVVLKEGE